MQVAVIEDDERTRNANQRLFEAAGATVTAFESAAAFEFAQDTFDLVVLDIRLPKTDGMTLAKRIRAVDAAVPLVFVSNYEEYVFAGYDVNALAYLMKPLTAAKVAGVLEKVAALTPPASIVVTAPEETRRINLFDLLAVEVRNHDLVFHLQQGDFAAPGRLRDYLGLTEQGFVQVYRSVLVNLSFISRLRSDSVVLADGSSYPLSRQQKAKVRAAFFAHYRGLADDD